MSQIDSLFSQSIFDQISYNYTTEVVNKVDCPNFLELQSDAEFVNVLTRLIPICENVRELWREIAIKVAEIDPFDENKLNEMVANFENSNK